METFNTE